MSASLVGSEMCIRDRDYARTLGRHQCPRYVGVRKLRSNSSQNWSVQASTGFRSFVFKQFLNMQHGFRRSKLELHGSRNDLSVAPPSTRGVDDALE
eukprot:3988340-Alexandrium_andersonii.AAC.1